MYYLMAFGTYNCDYLLRESASSSWAVSAVLWNAGFTRNKGQLGCQCLHRLANETSLPVSSMSKEHVENTRALGRARCSESPGGHRGQASERLRCHMSRLSSLNLRWVSCSANHLDRNPYAHHHAGSSRMIERIIWKEQMQLVQPGPLTIMGLPPHPISKLISSLITSASKCVCQ